MQLNLAIPLALLAAATAYASGDKLVRFAGEVSRGREFRRPIGRGLIFVLVPDNSYPGIISGWTITVSPERPQEEPDCTDYAWVVMPPYRSSNARYLSTSYATQAEEAVAWSPRSFNFVLNCRDYEVESARVNIVLWPYSHSNNERDDALAKLGTSQQGKGNLWIDKSRIGKAAREVDGVNHGSIDWIQFHVEIRFP